MIRLKLTNISKKFNLNLGKSKGALERMVSFFSKKEPQQEFWAVKNISFQARAGENLGIIGKNGSGKSTLLRVIAGVYISNEGSLETNGEAVYLTGFSHSLKPKLTMRENIFLSGAIMGLSQNSIKKKFNEVVEFSGLKNYLDVKVSKFSTGMTLRLTSSIGLYCVAHRDPDILLIDEVLGAGADIDFQKKALSKVEELLRGKATVIFVSHNLEFIKNYCDRVLWIDKGRIVAEGEPEEICDRYINNKI